MEENTTSQDGLYATISYWGGIKKPPKTTPNRNGGLFLQARYGGKQTMDILVIVLILGLFIWVLWLNYKIEKEKKRNRILQAFIAGTIRSVSNYKSKTDEIDDADDLPAQNSQLPIPYENILENIDWEFSKDFWIEPFKKWLKHDRKLFDDSKYKNDGFNFIYWDFFDKRLKEWFSKELISPKNKAYIRDDIEITGDNVNELEGEIAMLKDLLTSA